MKKFLAVILPLALLASLALGAGYTAMHQWPKGRVYNYLSAGTMGSFIESPPAPWVLLSKIWTARWLPGKATGYC